MPYIIKHYPVTSPSYVTHTSHTHKPHIIHHPTLRPTFKNFNPHFVRNSSKRPYGVGLLVAGCDEKGPHLFETCPSGNYFEYYAMVWALAFTADVWFLNWWSWKGNKMWIFSDRFCCCVCWEQRFFWLRCFKTHKRAQRESFFENHGWNLYFDEFSWKFHIIHMINTMNIL